MMDVCIYVKLLVYWYLHAVDSSRQLTLDDGSLPIIAAKQFFFGADRPITTRPCLLV